MKQLNQVGILAKDMVEYAMKKTRKDMGSAYPAEIIWSEGAASVVDPPIFRFRKAPLRLERHTFYVCGYVEPGSVEGIYGSLVYMGEPINGERFLCLYSVKSLERDADSYLRLGEVMTRMAYHANEYVAANLDKFQTSGCEEVA